MRPALRNSDPLLLPLLRLPQSDFGGPNLTSFFLGKPRIKHGPVNPPTLPDLEAARDALLLSGFPSRIVCE